MYRAVLFLIDFKLLDPKFHKRTVGSIKVIVCGYRENTVTFWLTFCDGMRLVMCVSQVVCHVVGSCLSNVGCVVDHNVSMVL